EGRVRLSVSSGSGGKRHPSCGRAPRHRLLRGIPRGVAPHAFTARVLTGLKADTHRVPTLDTVRGEPLMLVERAGRGERTVAAVTDTAASPNRGGTGGHGGPPSSDGVGCAILGRMPRLLGPGGACSCDHAGRGSSQRQPDCGPARSSSCGHAGGCSSQQRPECGRALLRNASVAERMHLLVPREPDLRRGDVPLLEPHQPLDEPRAQPWLSGPSGLSGSGSIPSGGALPPSDGGSVGSPIRATAEGSIRSPDEPRWFGPPFVPSVARGVGNRVTAVRRSGPPEPCKPGPFV